MSTSTSSGGGGVGLAGKIPRQASAEDRTEVLRYIETRSLYNDKKKLLKDSETLYLPTMF